MSDRWLALTRALHDTIRVHAPGWTDRADADPSVTMLEIAAYLAEGVRRYSAPSDERSSAAARAIRSLEALAADAVSSGPSAIVCWSGTTRPNYFSGKVLTADDLRDEQQYHLAKHRRHLRTLHGWGVVSGLNVSVGSDGASVTVDAGMAIDAQGREIVLGEPVAVTPAADAISPALVVVSYAERAIDHVPIAGDEPQASRIEEGCCIALTAAPGDSGVTIARLVRDAEGWRLDADR